MNSPLRCQCGTVQGHVDLRRAYGRAICYCKDCQAHARILERDRDVLNRQGGTEIIATLPSSVHFTSGADHLACLTLTEKGPLRWYASCCKTPIGNTPQNSKIAYVGLIRASLNTTNAALDQAMGPVKIALNTNSARGEVRSTPWANFVGVFRIFGNILRARWTGRHKENPFFLSGTNKPIQKPRAIKRTERGALKPLA